MKALTNRAITGLGAEYDTFLTAFYQHHRLIPERDADGTVIKEGVRFNDAVMAAEGEEAQQKIRGEMKAATAFLARTAPQQRKGCTKCGNPWHTVDVCWELYPPIKAEHDARKAAERASGGGKKRKRARRDDAKKEDPKADVQAVALNWEPNLDDDVYLVSIAALSIQDTGRFLENNWIADTGCSHHTSCRRDFFLEHTLKPINHAGTYGYGGASQKPIMIGTAVIPCEVDGKRKNLLLSNTHLNPTGGCNLISTAQLRRKGAQLQFHPDGSLKITTPRATFTADERENLLILRLWKGDAATALAAYGIETP